VAQEWRKKEMKKENRQDNCFDQGVLVETSGLEPPTSCVQIILEGFSTWDYTLVTSSSWTSMDRGRPRTTRNDNESGARVAREKR